MVKLRQRNECRRVPALIVRHVSRSLLLASGVERSVAEATADGLWHASLRGTDSHGVRLLPHYLLGVKKGRINPRPKFVYHRTAASTGNLDADHTFGHAAGVRAMDEAITMARDTGAGFVSVSNSSHCGAMSYFGLRACEEDMIGLALTHASPKLLTPGSTTSFLGTNPICVCAPMAGESPFCFDSAPTMITSNLLNILKETGLPLPIGSAADAAGRSTTDAKRAKQLVPIGGYKGFGLSMVVEIFCALLSGMPAGPKVTMMYLDPMHHKRFLGQFYGAIRINAFDEPEVFKSRLTELCNGIRRLPMSDDADQTPMAPGDPEKHSEADRFANGIPLPEHLIAKLDAIAGRMGVESLTSP